MQKKIFINLLIISLCGIFVTTLVLYIIQTAIARNAAKETFSLQLANVAEHIRQNDLRTRDLIQATKDDYISRARALAMMIELEPGIIENRRKLDEATVALNVDEVHIIDESGILWWGTEPQYYGMNFAYSEQASPFLAILDDPALEIAQDPMPNGSAGLMRQYAAVSLRNKKGIAQIGMVPERLENILKDTNIRNVLSGMLVGNTGYIFSVTADNGIISSHPNNKLIGTMLPEPLRDTGFMILDEKRVMYKTLQVGDQILAAVIPLTELYAQREFYTVIFMCFMILVFSAFGGIVITYIKKNVINGILETVSTLEAISAGNLEVTANVRSNEEFEKLSDGINHMLRSIKTKMDEIAALAGDLKRLGAIVAIADAGIIVKDENGVVLEWNIGAENIIGYKPEEIIGKSTKAYAPEQAHAGIDEIEERLRTGDHIAHLEVVRQHKDGRLIDCSASYTPIFGEDGSFIGSVAIFHDISDKKEIEQALHNAVLEAKQANSAKSSFIANMSHEIRTPLNGIIGFAELGVDDYKDRKKTKDYLEKIKLSGESLLQIINDVLDISKIEAGKMELEKTPFSIHEVLELCETISSTKADEKGVALYFYAEPPVSKNLLGDPTKLRQIILNLVSNAIKFTNRGMVKVMAIIEESCEDSVVIRFEVKDNGIGMTAEQIKKIFDPFTQADGSTTRKYGGTGLGLSITKNMIELMGGTLGVESTSGVGSKFTFSLRFELDEPLGNTSVIDEIPWSGLQKPTFNGEVLVCEDNEINQQVIEGRLSKVGLIATIVENGLLGVEAVKNKKGKPYDLIFMDIQMPVMDGLEASQRLMEIGNTSPVIALTANAMSRDIEIYLNNGMCDYLAKPFVARDLWKCLLKHLTPLDVDLDVDNVSDTEQDVPAPNSGRVIDGSLLDRQAGIAQSGDDEELYDRLLKRFVTDNQCTFQKICEAIEAGDIKLANRLTHTLRGLAGTLGAAGLQKAALAVENRLSGEAASVTPEEMRALEDGLNAVLTELAHFLEKGQTNVQQTDAFDKAASMRLINELVPMLEDFDMQSLELIPKIQEVLSPLGEETEKLITRIEDCDFELALETAESIRQTL